MEKKTYTYGVKLAGVIFHLFFTVVFTVSVFLLAAMIGKNIFSLADIGTETFFDSVYYTKCVEQKCDDLSEYLYLMQKGKERSAQEERRYLQFTNKFKREASNFCFWYKADGVWHTNQPDTETGQSFDAQDILMQAKSMGDYLLYDMENKEFGTDIRGLDSYFFQGYGDRAYWPLEHVVLAIGVDTELSARDDLYEAKKEYEQLHPWIKVSIAAAIVSLMGWILSLVYLTLTAGYGGEDGEIRLNFLDKIKTEILFLLFVAGISELLLLAGRFNIQSWDVSGLLAASGTVSLMIDILFLIFYLSMVRRMKAEVIWKNSLACWLVQGAGKVFRERTVTMRVLAAFSVHMAVCFCLALGTFYYQYALSLILLLIFSAMEAYLLLRRAVERARIFRAVEEISQGALDAKIDTEKLHGEDKKLAEAINHISEGLHHAVEESIKNERMKADLITNVSHDIKTPLTSIINYVNLIKRENIDNERVRNYISVLDEKSLRLKHLTEELVETSRITSGSVKLDMQKIDLIELVYQTGGEFNEKFEKKELTVVTKIPHREVFVRADGGQLYRVLENLYHNVAKYAMEKTRVYVEVQSGGEEVVFSIKNISERSLAQENSNSLDLTERFIRGDSARTTEGSGLGLSIAKNLTQLMGGTFEIEVDGDLFKAVLVFPVYQKAEKDDGKELDFF